MSTNGAGAARGVTGFHSSAAGRFDDKERAAEKDRAKLHGTATSDGGLEVDSLEAPPRSSLGAYLAAALCLGIVGFGWWLRDEAYLEAGSGLGYQLGIGGAAGMLLLLLYSARKRLRLLDSWGPLSFWFRVHMWLGVLGPIAILFHCNFQLGSLNSSLSLASMLLVAGSGVVGRYMYSKVHYGLYGRRVLLREKRHELTQAEGVLRPQLEAFPEVTERLDIFEKRCAQPASTTPVAIARLATLGFRARRVRAACFGMLPPVLFEERQAVTDYLGLACRVAKFGAYERLFRLWHAVHVPLFVMMILTLVLHVVAVHMY